MLSTACLDSRGSPEGEDNTSETEANRERMIDLANMMLMLDTGEGRTEDLGNSQGSRGPFIAEFLPRQFKTAYVCGRS